MTKKPMRTVLEFEGERHELRPIVNLEGDEFDTAAAWLIDGNVLLKLSAADTQNLCDAIAAELRKTYRRGNSDGYQEAYREWRSAPADGFDGIN